MKKIVLILIPIAILTAFVLLMNSGTVFLKITNGYNVSEHIEEIKKNINNNEWNDAKTKTDELKNKLEKKIYPKIQYGVEIDEMNEIVNSVARLKGYIKTQDKSEAMAEIYDIENHWDNIGN